jgi:hypothetical protein
VKGWAIAQCVGDAIFIPAGAPHQVSSLVDKELEPRWIFLAFWMIPNCVLNVAICLGIGHWSLIYCVLDMVCLLTDS